MGPEPSEPLSEDLQIAGWFAPENRATLGRLIAEHRVRTVLEIGTCFGLSAGWFAQRVERVTCIDVWWEIPCAAVPANVYEIFVSNMEALGVRNKIVIVRGNSHLDEVCASVGDFDLVYIDGDHTYPGCKQDIRMYGPKARKVLCGDDYAPDHPDLIGVVQAVDEMLPDCSKAGRFWWSLT